MKNKENILNNDTSTSQTSKLLSMLEGRWKAQILYELRNYDSVRFSTLKKKLPGITNTMLSKSLRELEKDGLVERTLYSEIPLHVEYSFTPMGKDLLPIFNEITNWGNKYEKDLLQRGV